MENKEVKPRVKKGLWKPEEDLILKTYVETHGEGKWATVSQKSGLMRGGKSCRLRWKNYLRPNIKRGGMSREEEDLIIRMHKLLGNRWSLIAGRLPGRTDNEVKNYWNTHLNKRCSSGKRKPVDSNRNQDNINEDDHQKMDERTSRRVSNFHPIDTSSPPTTSAANLNGEKQDKEECIVDEVWMQNAQSMNFYIESPMAPANNATFIFDDGSFIPYFDSSALFQ